MSALVRRRSAFLAAALFFCGSASAAALAQASSPTSLRPVQTKTDCDFVSIATSAACDANVRGGTLQLLWDEASDKVDGYKLYRVDGGHHALIVRTANGSAPAYAVIPKPRDGYLGKCYTVAAYTGRTDSPESQKYCVGPGAIAFVRSIAPYRVASIVHWSVPTVYARCKAEVPDHQLLPAQVFQLAQPTGFNAFFPWLTGFRNPELTGTTRQLSVQFAGVQAYGLVTGLDNGFVAGCPNGTNSLAGFAMVTARTGLGFDLRRLAGHKIYAARLTLNASQAVRNEGNRFLTVNDYSCATSLAVATDAWWRSGNMPYHQKGQATFGLAPVPSVTLDVTPIVAAWAGNFDRDDYGFVLRSRLEDGTPLQSFACMTQYTNPQLDLVFF